MKYDSEHELRVLWIVKELGLASIEEVEERYQTLFNKACEDCNLVLRRWKARKAFAIEDGRYKIADIPPWFKSLRQDQLIHLNKTESKTMLKDLEDQFLGGEVVGGKVPLWRDFQMYELTFEALDPILGGTPTDEMGKTVFPREGNKLIVPMNWLYGFTRDNQSLINVTGLHHHIAWAKGYWEDGIETITLKAPVTSQGKGVGVAEYESIPVGKKFTVKARFPTHGSTLNTTEKIKQWLDMTSETPIRGLGANSKAYGGRIKLIDIKELP